MSGYKTLRDISTCQVTVGNLALKGRADMRVQGWIDGTWGSTNSEQILVFHADSNKYMNKCPRQVYSSEVIEDWSNLIVSLEMELWVGGLVYQSALKMSLNSCSLCELLTYLWNCCMPASAVSQILVCLCRNIWFQYSLSGQLFCLCTARWASSAPISMVCVGSAELRQPCWSEPQKLDTY